MTVETTSYKVTYDTDGATTAFPFDFPAVNAGYIHVYLVDLDDGTTVELTQGQGSSQFQVVLNAPVPPNPTGVGGTVNYNPAGVPVPVGSSLTIVRELPSTQDTSLANQGTLYQKVIEAALDYVTMLLQQVPASNAIVAPPSDPPGLTYELPAVAARAGLALTFDEDGNVSASAIQEGDIVSAAMIPVVAAATLALARTAMGLGNIAVEDIGPGLADDGAGNLRVNPVVTAVAVGQNPVSADHLKYYNATGPINFTLARANTYFSGFGFYVWTASSTVTFVINAADTITGYGLGSGVSVTIPAGCLAWVSTDAQNAGTWFVQRIMAPKPTITTMLGGGGTYNTPAGCTRLEVYGKGGGGGSGSAGVPTAGTNGGQTIFGSITVNGGTAGSNTGGTGGTLAAGVPTWSFPGQDGQTGEFAVNTGALSTTGIGGEGGGSGGGRNNGTGKANTGGGGAGQSAAPGGGGTAIQAGGGGGEGAEFFLVINNPDAQYSFTVGAGGSTAGGGGNGGAGMLRVIERYD